MPLIAPLSKRFRPRNVRRFVEQIAARHPEVRRQVDFADVAAIAVRENIRISLDVLPPRQRARTFALFGRQFIQLNRSMAPGELALQGMHELCHVWCDKPIDGAYYSDELTSGETCEFADLFAWYVTSPARSIFDPASNQFDLEL